MKLLVLAQNLEINRTSSGLRSHKHLILYKKIYKNIDVITSTPNHLMHNLNGIEYYHIKQEISNKKVWYNKIPKSIALQNFVLGQEINARKIIKKWIDKTDYLLSTNEYGLVVSLDTGASFQAAFALYYLKRRIQFKHLMFVHDPYPLNQYPPPFQKKNSLPFISIAKLFGKAIKSADIISFPSLMLMEWMNNYYPVIKSKYIIQPHIGLTLAQIKPFLPIQNNQEIPIFSKGINIVHTGSLLKERIPNHIIKALQLLFENYPESKDVINLHIIGKINKYWNTQKMVSDNVFIHSKRFTYLESLEIQQKAEVLLLLEAVSEISPIMMGKLADYLMAKKPILALTPSKSETTRILGKDYALLAENGNIEQIYNKLVLIYNAYLNNSVDKLVPSSKARNHVSPEKWLKELEKIKTDKQI